MAPGSKEMHAESKAGSWKSTVALVPLPMQERS
eukprot:CAMPEP_0180699406 /NCGR_PEP_ID=MMETSP1038_2-20121128/4537_1 /TAXON_ID=632150 /ORGANISM="Azadinium spinosum, Strain 3D9" /LENGTH=32 /DNA_ID= /DNA_START= /DNA_END= /DNA_ORIENTATION=